ALHVAGGPFFGGKFRPLLTRVQKSLSELQPSEPAQLGDYFFNFNTQTFGNAVMFGYATYFNHSQRADVEKMVRNVSRGAGQSLGLYVSNYTESDGKIIRYSSPPADEYLGVTYLSHADAENAVIGYDQLWASRPTNTTHRALA